MVVRLAMADRAASAASKRDPRFDELDLLVAIELKKERRGRGRKRRVAAKRKTAPASYETRRIEWLRDRGLHQQAQIELAAMRARAKDLRAQVRRDRANIALRERVFPKRRAEAFA